MSVEYVIMLQQDSAHFHLNQLTLHVLGRTNYPYTSLEIQLTSTHNVMHQYLADTLIPT